VVGPPELIEHSPGGPRAPAPPRLRVPRLGPGRPSPSPSPPVPPGPSTWPSANDWTGPSSSTAWAGGFAETAPPGWCGAWRSEGASSSASAPTACATPSSPPPSTPEFPYGTCKKPPPTPIPHRHALRPSLAVPRPSCHLHRGHLGGRRLARRLRKPHPPIADDIARALVVEGRRSRALRDHRLASRSRGGHGQGVNGAHRTHASHIPGASLRTTQRTNQAPRARPSRPTSRCSFAMKLWPRRRASARAKTVTRRARSVNRSNRQPRSHLSPAWTGAKPAFSTCGRTPRREDPQPQPCELWRVGC